MNVGAGGSPGITADMPILASLGQVDLEADRGFKSASKLQPPRGALRAVGGERAACEDRAWPQDGRARQRVARPAPRTRPAPPELRAPGRAARAARRGALPQAADRGPGAGSQPGGEGPRDRE